ncbi:hypothetical protein [Streptomyces sp. KR55]|uniref:hypothetical protein n=1 Tax=Streptomyces sp. KR55 TaxID=3457425 RepID=UPI003FD3A6E3
MPNHTVRGRAQSLPVRADNHGQQQGLALLWDSAASAARSLPALATKTFGCAPSHRWAFELDEALQPKPGGPLGLPQELSLLLHA